MQVHFYEAFAEEAAALKRYLPPQVQAGYTWKSIQESGDAAPPARLISIRTQSVIPAAWHSQLDGILSRTTGYDTVAALPVACGYLPLYCNRAVAEQAMLLWMALLRKLPQQLQQFGRFHRDGLTGRETLGKNLLVVGAGHIGSELVKIGQGLGMQVRRVDLLPARSDTSIEAGLPWADIVVCSMNLTAHNRGYFNYERLNQTKSGALFINVARGEHAVTADLARLLDEAHLGGVALDVYEDESALGAALRAGQGSFPLAGRSNVICTPHNSFNTAEAVERKSEQSARSVAAFLQTGQFPWPVPRATEPPTARCPG